MFYFHLSQFQLGEKKPNSSNISVYDRSKWTKAHAECAASPGLLLQLNTALPTQQGKLAEEPASILDYSFWESLKIIPDVALILHIFNDCLFQKLFFTSKNMKRVWRDSAGFLPA